MLNLGMTEILCFAVIALLVLGPDKLPEAARFAAKWYGKLKKFINNIQNEIDRELRLSEFREEMQKEINKITELERRMQQQLDEMKRTKVIQDQQKMAEKKQDIISYHPFTSTITIPFSIQYQTLSFDHCTQNLSTVKFDPELKIAV